MSGQFSKAFERLDQAKVYSAIQELLEKGEDPNLHSADEWPPIFYAYWHGYTDSMRLLKKYGADDSFLALSELFKSVIYGNSDDLKVLVQKEVDLTSLDVFGRTPFLVSVFAGDVEKAEILLQAGSDRDAVDKSGKGAVYLAVLNDNADVLELLIESGFEYRFYLSDQDEFKGYTYDTFDKSPLHQAVLYDSKECIRVLLNAGADINLKNSIGQSPIQYAHSVEIANILLEGGANINHVDYDIRHKMLGYHGYQRHSDNIDFDDPKITLADYNRDKKIRCGKTNPELSTNYFWTAMVKWGGPAVYGPREKFNDPDSYGGDPVWCYDRYGMSLTPLPDGRFIEIGGVHEDLYMTDHHVYNDVIIHDGKGECLIYMYPEKVFPPIVYHTATLVDDSIYIIGNMRNYKTEIYTPIYCLNLKTMKINKIDAKNSLPGLFCEHDAHYDGEGNIVISGGRIFTRTLFKKNTSTNEKNYAFNLKTLKWSAL